jgi:pilus assembly protein Flp/PilA
MLPVGSLAAEGVIPNRYDKRRRRGFFVLTTWDPEGSKQAGVGLKRSALYPKEPALVLFSSGSLCKEDDWNGGIQMKSLTQKLQRFLVSEDGPTAVEYAVMLALIVIVCLTAISALGTKTSATFNKIGSSLGN